MNRLAACLLGFALLVSAATTLAQRAPDPDVLRLQEQLQALDGDPSLAELAGLARLKARQAVASLQTARRSDREHALFLANRWVEAAVASARAELLQQQAAQLDRERDQIMLEASRRDAERARREADDLRRQTLAREEEAQRLAEQVEAERLASQQTTADAEEEARQARKLADARGREAELARKEAELAAAVGSDVAPIGSLPPMRRNGSRSIYTLDGSAFASGKANLTPGARASLQRLAKAMPARGSIRIVGYTDSQGDDAANLALSRQRAEAVKASLQSAGIAASRLGASGKGEADPVADNATAAGRARNRRVEIAVE
ncbi:OmpA family protein [Arenimonas sp.]|uniref:OmpA family protein n=1 Tax=Arenimonas sp. TaxID=1872635 RepID=UPI0039E61476